MCLLRGGVGKGKSFVFNHKIMIKVTRKPMVCESLSKGLVVLGEDASPQVHPT